uniref:Leucine-rich repeat transmembrane protein FLRT2-like n=1 Tax=Phallusia mammillata TaxID=59560 RepID=A0A6F9DDS7_9ASCI|nr:leucine-rich repeat transmembrane protein FLRT2-like [Phallusia mammillata]
MTRQWLLLIFTFATFIMTSKCCPRECRCDSRRKTVYCHEKNLTTLPLWIPSDTKVLLLQRNNIGNSPELEAGLKELVNLEKLDLHNNKLTSFPCGLPSSLTYLSLSNNMLKYIGKDALKGLGNLQNLNLDGNNLTNEGMSQVKFDDVSSLDELVLSSNEMTSLPDALPASLKSLRVDHNKLDVIDSGSFSGNSQLITLDASWNQLDVGGLKGLSLLQNLRTLDLSRNKVSNIPSDLPENITDLLLSFNSIQYVFASAGTFGKIPHGDLQGFPQLQNLDLSSNQLRSVESGAFANLPITASVEIHDNPWRCDCNLVYLKTWFTHTTSVVASGNIRCSTPYSFSDVTLASIDVEALQCTRSSYAFMLSDITDSDVTIDYAATREPPYVTFTVMYGEMLCQSCEIESEDNSRLSTAAMWMEDYTILPISPGVAKEITGLQPSTRYAVCIVASYQHPDRIGIEQCDDFMTANVTATTSPLPINTSAIPIWVYAMTGVLALLVVIALVLIVVWKMKSRTPETRSYTQQPIPQQYLPNFLITQDPMTSQGRSLQNANKEFDVTLMVRRDLPHHHSDSCYSDSHDETTSTIHTGTGTMTSRTSHHIYEHLTSPSDQLLPSDVMPPTIPVAGATTMIV